MIIVIAVVATTVLLLLVVVVLVVVMVTVVCRRKIKDEYDSESECQQFNQEEKEPTHGGHYLGQPPAQAEPDLLAQ